MMIEVWSTVGQCSVVSPRSFSTGAREPDDGGVGVVYKVSTVVRQAEGGRATCVEEEIQFNSESTARIIA